MAVTDAGSLQIREVPVSERLLLTEQDAAELLSLTPVALRKLPISRVTIPLVRGVRYRRCDLELYVRSLLESTP